MDAIGPVRSEERISSLDTLRGFALLGILLMNIVGFGLHHASYDNPAVAGGATGLNFWAWVTMHILAEGKMRCLFSMVFGAGVILLTSRAEQRGAGSLSADIFLRRNLWLLLFGLAHAYLLWYGDILYPYALCALALYPFRHLPARRLLAIGAALVVITAAAGAFQGHATREALAKGAAAERLAASGTKLTSEQEEAKKKYEEIQREALPPPADIEKNNSKWRGGVVDVFKVRAALVWRWHNLAYYHHMNLDLFSMMFLGMAFYKLGIFSAARSPRFYAVLAAAGYLIGISVNSATAWIIVRSGFDLPTRLFTYTVYDVGRLSIALAHMSVLMLFCQKGLLGWLLRPLAAIGQTALSNYVFHSVVCSTLFAGYGFGLFGYLERYQLYYVVISIWVVQLVISPVWLRYFRFGPLEWCWRSLTYWKRQPMRIAAPETASVPITA